MWVIDLSGEIKHSWNLDFLHARHIVGITVQIKVSNNIALLKKAEDENMHVCGNNGRLKFSFTLTERFGQAFLSNSGEDRIFVEHRRTLCAYTQKGNLNKKKLLNFLNVKTCMI